MGKNSKNDGGKKKAFKSSKEGSGSSSTPSESVLMSRVNAEKDRKAKTVLFSGNGPLELLLALPAITAKFQENTCWDLIDHPTLAVSIAARATAVPAAGGVGGIVGALAEDVFAGGLVPPDTTTVAGSPTFARLATLRADCNARHAQNVLLINALPNAVMGVHLKAYEVHKDNLKRDEELEKIDHSELQVQSTFLSAFATWDKERLLFQSKQARCLKVFQEVFSENVLALVRTELNALSFREAFTRIRLRYHVGVGGAAMATSINRSLSEIVWLRKKDSISRFIQIVETIASNLAAAGGGTCTEQTIMRYVCEGIQRSGTRDYDLDIQDIQRNEVGLDRGREILLKTETNLLASRQRRMNEEHHGRIRERSNMAVEEDDSYLTVKEVTALFSQLSKDTQGKGNSASSYSKCKKCGKMHRGKCWSDIVCNKCGKKGHPEFKCDSSVKSEKSTSSNESLTKQLQQFTGDKVELVKLFEKSKK